jgi:hypothetical protein
VCVCVCVDGVYGKGEDQKCESSGGNFTVPVIKVSYCQTIEMKKDTSILNSNETERLSKDGQAVLYPVIKQYLKPYVSRQDRLCGLVVRVSGYSSEMYCASCEVRTEFVYVM